MMSLYSSWKSSNYVSSGSCSFSNSPSSCLLLVLWNLILYKGSLVFRLMRPLCWFMELSAHALPSGSLLGKPQPPWTPVCLLILSKTALLGGILHRSWANASPLKASRGNESALLSCFSSLRGQSCPTYCLIWQSLLYWGGFSSSLQQMSSPDANYFTMTRVEVPFIAIILIILL